MKVRSFLRTGKKGIMGALHGALFIRLRYLYMFRDGSNMSCRSWQNGIIYYHALLSCKIWGYTLFVIILILKSHFKYHGDYSGCPKKSVHFLNWLSFGTGSKQRFENLTRFFRLTSVFKCRFSAKSRFFRKVENFRFFNFWNKTFSTLFCPKSQFPVPKIA